MTKFIPSKEQGIAWLSKAHKDGTVECYACNHRCKIKSGNTGICGVRRNDDGQLHLLVYGRAIAHNVDPIEKKPLYHFYPDSEIFSIGTVGCNFRCHFCQNYHISQYHRLKEGNVKSSGVLLMPKNIIDFCLENSIPSIAFTYNEPAIFFEYAYDTAKLAHENNLKTVYVSNGFETKEALEKISPYLDAINIDLKSFRNEFYLKICGARLEPVKENIRYLWKENIWLEVTTLLIPGHNDSDEELKNIVDFLVNVSPDLPWHISRYHPCYKMNAPSTPMESLEKAYQIGKKAGLKYVYLGNVPGTDKEHTYCSKCDKILIERYGYSTNSQIEKDGKCPECGEEIAGKF